MGIVQMDTKVPSTGNLQRPIVRILAHIGRIEVLCHIGPRRIGYERRKIVCGGAWWTHTQIVQLGRDVHWWSKSWAGHVRHLVLFSPFLIGRLSLSSCTARSGSRLRQQTCFELRVVTPQRFMDDGELAICPRVSQGYPDQVLVYVASPVGSMRCLIRTQ